MSVSFYTHILNDSGYILRKTPNELFGQPNIWREITGARFGLAEHYLTSPGYSPKKWSESRILITEKRLITVLVMIFLSLKGKGQPARLFPC